MGGNILLRNGLAIGIIFLFTISSLTSMTFGYNVEVSDKETIAEDYNFDRYFYPEYYDCYNVDEIFDYGSAHDFESGTNYVNIDSEKIVNSEEPAQLLNGPMDSPWPMYCHDTRHTGRSPYSTASNTGIEKWRFGIYGPVWGGPVVDEEGIIYIGSDSVYAIWPNGTLKWGYEERFRVASTPAIDNNGVIYVGAYWAGPQYMFAINKNNGTLKWKYHVGDWIASSPAIGDDGSIYFGSENDYIYALYPNGTLKWKYLTSIAVYSSPAIGDDGTVYCGSHDGNLYALYPNNGTLKWKYSTGDWVGRGPCIADDGTIYFGSWDGYLYAVYANGTLKWKTGGYLAGTTPVVAQDGTIYVGNRYLSAIYPNNGSVKWTFDPGPERTIRGGNPCISADGTIFFGTHIGETDGGELIAVNPDGTERWRLMIATDWVGSAPAIGDDGTIYVGSTNDLYHPGSEGYLHAIGKLDPDAPSAPDIDGPTNGNAGTEYSYTFKSTSPIGNDIYYWIEWGDNTGTGWIGPYTSGQKITVDHTYSNQGTFTIKARAKDTDNLWGPWGELEVTMPVNYQISQQSSNSLFMQILQQLFQTIW